MPNCPNCGSPTDENMAFCPKCGTSLKAPSANQATPQNKAAANPRPIITLTNGIMIGVGSVLVVLGLIGAFALNSNFVTIRDYLVHTSGGASAVQFTLRGIVSLISLCPWGIIFGSCILIFGSLNQWNRAARKAFENKESPPHLASGLLSAGSVLASLASINVVEQFYFPESGWFASVSLVVVSVGIAVMVAGVFVLVKPKTAPSRRVGQ